MSVLVWMAVGVGVFIVVLLFALALCVGAAEGDRREPR